MKFSGFIMGAAYYDTNSNITRPWLNKVNGKSDDRSLDIDPLPTRLIVTATVKHEGLEGKGYVEGDLKSADISRLRQAYASIGGTWGTLLVGQAYTMAGGWNFIDSYNIDAYFNQGATYTRQPQVRYSRKMGDLQFHLAAATFRGMGSVVVAGGAGGTATITELGETPYMMARVEHAIMGKGFIAAGATAGQFEVAFTPSAMMPGLAAFKKKATAVLGAIDVVVPFGKHKLAAHAFYSRSGGQGAGANLAVTVQSDGTLKPVVAYGGFVNLVFGLGQGMRVSLFGTVDNPTDHAGKINLPVERNLVGGALFGKELLPKLEAGVMVEYAETKTEADKFHDIRTTAAVKYGF